MSTEKTITRRRMLKAAVVGASSIAAGKVGTRLMADTNEISTTTSSTATVAQVLVKQRCPDSPRIRGPFPILSTPFTPSGDVDFEGTRPAGTFSRLV